MDIETKRGAATVSARRRRVPRVPLMSSVRNEYAEPPNDTVSLICTPWTNISWHFGMKTRISAGNELIIEIEMRVARRERVNEIGRLMMIQNESVISVENILNT